MEGAEEKSSRFEATALPFLPAVYNAACRLARNAEEARDLAQETYLRAYRTFENFRPGTNCKAWLLTILYSIFVNRYRKKQREPKTVPLEELEERFPCAAAEEPVTPQQTAGSPPQWTNREVEEAFRELPESFRAVVLLVDVEELSYEEAAAALGVPVGTVRSRLSRARRQLSGALGEHARRAGYRRDSAVQS
jgi:RNA polymerase sigma-70 factor (ECF subfamily)